ncbi:PQQ-binding-like beta-propeller repeat protein [Maribacter confluentis]|uniref:PQQ-binding-like beta-propeller repeat protein n=1 Tax=Maribacter confluentis TaxID=1656093 RepID=A0ABT8RS09_9FLAO|nr:PQQ-binding-like beta-propeller repeat protein [Maribacter confluentis]MDO1513297.1 PQQ-binding-like beta-propeller repeat protein [Maribacter confluentis]
MNSFLITSKDETVYTVDAETGEWTSIYSFPDYTDLELVADYKDDTIYVTTDDNSINALSVTNKRFLWDTPMLEYDFSSNGVTPPICIDGVCYASGGSGVVVAVNQNDGLLKWYYTTDPDGELDYVLNENAIPLVYGDKVFVFSEEGFVIDLPAYMHVLDKETGTLLRKIELPYEVTGTPYFKDNVLYLPAKNLYALDAETLDVIWTFEANGVGTPAVSNGKLVVNAIPTGELISSVLYCIDLASNSVIWQIDTGTDTLWSPLIVQNVVFSNYDNGSSFAFTTSARLFALNLATGEQLWYNNDVVIDHSPVFANGRLFFRGHNLAGEGGTDENVGLLSMDANTGRVLWLNTFFRYGSALVPLVVAENGVFGPSYYRGN